MKTMYITIAGMNHYYGSEIFEKGMKVKLEKEPDNPYDREAIAARIKGLGKIGYVANSPYTVQGESMRVVSMIKLEIRQMRKSSLFYLKALYAE